MQGVYSHLVSRHLIFASLAVTLLAASMSGTAVAVAFPQIRSTFNVSLVVAGWVLSANLLATVASAPIMGKAADSFGRKRTFIFFAVVFMVGTFASAVAQNIYWLIGARLVQGVASGALVSSSTGILAEVYPRSRQRSVGLIVSIINLGGVLGPNIGGWLVESYGWQSIFWWALPLAAVALFGVVLFLKPDRHPSRVEMDLKGAGLLAGSLVSFMLGLTLVGSGGSGAFWWAPGATLMVAGLLLLLIFFRVEGKVARPMLEMELLKGRSFNAANMFNLLMGLNFGVAAILPFFAVTVFGLSTLQSGLIVSPRSAGMAIASFVATMVLMRSYRKPMVAGIIIMGLSWLFLALSAIDLGLSQTTRIGILLALVSFSGIGLGISLPASNNACIDLMPEHVSTMTGLRQTFRNLGATLGIALTSIVLHLSGLVRGFEIAFFGTAVLLFLALPFVFMMPRSADDPACAQATTYLPSVARSTGSSPNSSSGR